MWRREPWEEEHWRCWNERLQAALSLHTCSHGYIRPRQRSSRSQQWTHHIQNHGGLFPRSHSWGIVCPWHRTISRFSHVRQLIPLSLRLLDSALVVWIWRRAGAGGTMPCSCPRLHIQLGHGSKILPTATTQDNKALWAAGAAQTLTVCAPLLGIQDSGLSVI